MSTLPQTVLTPALELDERKRLPARIRTLVILMLLVGAGSGWYLLAGWVASASERFYLLLPPVCAAGFLVLAPQGWRTLWPYLRRAWVYVGCLALLLLAYRLVLRFIVMPNVAFYVAMPRLGEQLACLYFAASLSLMVFLILGLLRFAGRGLDVLLNGPCPEPPPRRRLILRNDVPCLILLPLCFPYMLGALYVHRPKGTNYPAPAAVTGRSVEDVSFTTSDGLTLHGWFMPAKDGPAESTVLMCHGLGGVRSDVLSWHGVADALHANMLVFDFRGHGDSDGHTVTFGCQEKLDVLAALSYLRTERAPQARKIIGYGMSMGAASLALAAAEAEPPLDAVILDSSFTSAVELTDTALAVIPTPLRQFLVVPGVPLASLHAGCDLRTARPIDVIARIRSPLLLIHAQGDRLIPAENSRQLFAAAVEPKTLWITDTGDHCSSFAAEAEYLRKCRELVQR